MILIVMFLSFFLLISPAAYAGAVSIPVGSAAPGFTLNSIGGKAISLSEYKGKIVTLIYWRPDQERSVMALEDSKDILKRFNEKGVEVISLIAADNEKAGKIIEDKEIDFPVLLDSNRQVYGDYGIRVYPTTIIIDREGRFARDIPGHALTYKITLEGYLLHILGEIDEEKLQEMISPHKIKKDKSLLEAERRYNLALKFTEAGLIDQAIEAAKKSIEAKPDIAKSRILLGFLHLEMKEADKALEEFNKAIELEPDSHDAKTGLGGALILKGDLDRALEILTSASVANPYPQMTYYELGRIYELKGEKDNAIKMYKKAIEKIIKKKVLPSAISKCR